MKEFERSIEHKQIAQQEAERAKFIVAMAARSEGIGYTRRR